MDIYEEILKEYHTQHKKIKNSNEIRNNLLIKFLNNFSNKLDLSLLKNGIILILALTSDIIHDIFHLESRSVNKIKRNETNKVNQLLKLEIGIKNESSKIFQKEDNKENKNI